MFNNIFDSHAHYDSSKFNEDRKELLESLPQKGVRRVMTAGSNIKNSKKAAQIADEYDYIYFSAGIHPHDAKDADSDFEEEILKLAQNPKMKAVGEIGLDYHYDFSPREIQKDIFIKQIELAKKLDLPVIVHDREAHKDIMDILREYRPRGIIHSYSGSAEMAKELLDMGFYLGYTGVITFKNAVKPLEAVAATSMDRILLETDCPYLAPVPYRGKRSDSSMIIETAKVMANIKGVDVQNLLDITFNNACTVFNIKDL